ncbi:acyl carrier protein [Rhodobacterales bacterium HKCCE2091]|nr:acyl carrier protein [Rhodobacterales bacterium HKCCE2091]
MRDLADDRKAELKRFVEDKLLMGRPVAADEDLLLSGLLDSLAVMSLVAEVERLSGRPVPPTDVLVENFASLDAIEAYMVSRGAT